MCGIAGLFDLYGRHKVEGELLVSMANTLKHRGPDDSGFYVEDHLGLAFRRLSIVDLVEGNQPHYNEDRDVISICNGEIYNYRELRDLLTSKGHRFNTHCDVEILVHLYEEYGFDFLNKLNGQFAMAIYDKKGRTLFLARDHVGISPLFYTVVGGTLIFASEIKAILIHPSVQRDVDLTGLDQIFTFPGLVSPRTMFKNIYSLGPGHLMKAGNGNIETMKYWDLNYPLEDELEDSRPETFYRERLDELIRQAIKYRVHADVPVGFYLSGGVDSSLIAAVIKDIYPEGEWHSFSIGFNEADIDERKYQRLISNQVGSTHHEIVFDWSDISNRLKDAVYHAEYPLKESYDTCSLALSELVRKNGFKVVLTGEGADEMFAGYVGYRFDQLRQEQEDDLLDVAIAMENQIREKLWGDSRFLYERNFYEFKEIKAAIYSDVLNDNLNEFDCTNQEGFIDKSKVIHRHPIHKRSYIDFKLRISDHLLADHGDRVAYANSVEARYPFLDIDVIEFVKMIPPNLLLNGAKEKYILRKVSEKYLPEELTGREKFAFVAPGSPYLLKQNIQWMNDLLSYEKIKREGFFNPDTIERLKTRSCANHFTINQTFDNDLLMIVLTFEIFLEMFMAPRK